MQDRAAMSVNESGTCQIEWHAADTSAVASFADCSPCVHFVGFRGEEWWSAVKVWGMPDFVHPGWDLRARREIADGDTIVFAFGPSDQEPRGKSWSDYIEDEPHEGDEL